MSSSLHAPTQGSETLVPPPESRPPKVRQRSTRSLFDRGIVRRAVGDSFRKLNPRVQARNPVMFVVLVGSVLTTILFVRDLPSASASNSVFTGLVSAWLWFTVLFATFAEPMAEGRGKRQAAPRRSTRPEPGGHCAHSTGTVKG